MLITVHYSLPYLVPYVFSYVFLWKSRVCGARTRFQNGYCGFACTATQVRRRARAPSSSPCRFFNSFHWSHLFLFFFFRFRFRSCGAPSTKLFARTSMTNVSAGAKRSWEGHHHHHHGESDGRPRSPSYVHSNPPPYKRQRGREEGRGWREEKRGKRDSRERREYRSRERERDRDRDRERERDRNRERERDSRRAHEHNKDHDKHDTREKERRRKDDERRRTPAVASNGRPSVPPPQKVDSDREEGE